jgi:hypothetical protein
MRRVLGAILLSGLLGLTACDAAFEAALCKDASQKLCDKQFSCYPNLAAVSYGTKNNCISSWRAWCDSSEAATGCEIDNAQLAACRDDIAASKCGQYPAACNMLLTCYDQ